MKIFIATLALFIQTIDAQATLSAGSGRRIVNRTVSSSPVQCTISCVDPIKNKVVTSSSGSCSSVIPPAGCSVL